MKTCYRGLMAVLVLSIVATTTFPGDMSRSNSDASKPKLAATATVQKTQAQQPILSQPATAATNPNAGEQIKWQVISSGGGSGSSTNFKLSATAGQTATGVGSSTSYRVNQGFWQSFVASCCIGKRGNVNMAGGIDLSDLSALVSYLTGGTFVPSCVDAANVNGAGGIDVSDLSALVSYLTGGSFVLINCP